MSKKNKHYREKQESLKTERLIDANKLKREINEAAKQKGTNEAMKKAQAFNSLIDLQPTKYDEVEHVKKVINSLKARILALDSDLMMQKITREQYNYEGQLITNELGQLELRFGIVNKPAEPEQQVREEEDVPSFAKIDQNAPDSLNRMIDAGNTMVINKREVTSHDN